MVSRLVDYDRAAERYRQNRALSPGQRERWQGAIARSLPAAPLGVVADVGAGTGAFVPVWRELGASRVLALEPSAAMRASAGLQRPQGPRGSHLLAATAEHLPVRAGSTDVVWLSTVIHHLPDLVAGAREWRRVLRDGGRVLVRGYFPDASVVPWLDLLPPAGASRARSRFPSTARVAEVFAGAGLATLEVRNVAEPQAISGRDAATWIEAMRSADSILTALTDDEVAVGVAALRALGDEPLPAASLTLLVAEA